MVYVPLRGGYSIRAFDEGSPMSHVELQKCQCYMSVLFTLPNVTFKIRTCLMSLYFYLHMSHVTKPYGSC